MAKKVYDEDGLDMQKTDWSGDESTGNLPVSGRLVENYIKSIDDKGFCLQSDKIHFIVHISCTTEMSQTQNPLGGFISVAIYSYSHPYLFFRYS